MLGKVLTWMVLAIVCSTAIKVLLMLDTNKRVYNHIPGPCIAIDGIEQGAEDMELLADNTLIITSGLVYNEPKHRDHVKGRLFTYRFAEQGSSEERHTAEPITLTESATFKVDNFWPHGISSYTSNGKTILYVINHAREGDRVESFVYNAEKRTATHVKTITDPLIYAANDLVAVGPDKFFLTNDHFFGNKWAVLFFEYTLQFQLANVILYDGRAGHVVDSWLHGANGLAIDPKKEYLYVSLALSEMVRVYKLSRDLSVEKKSDIHLLSSPDNIFVDPTNGHLWIGAHPVFHQVADYLLDPFNKEKTAPSQILRVRIQEGHESWVITEPYADDGGNLKAATIAVYHKNHLLIGTVHDKLLHCYVINEELA